MKVIVTGSSQGIGRGVAEEFLLSGHTVIGIDVCPATIVRGNYTHFTADILTGELPDIDGVNVLVNNAGCSEHRAGY